MIGGTSVAFWIVVGILLFLRIFWFLYQSYSKQRLRRRLTEIHRKP